MTSGNRALTHVVTGAFGYTGRYIAQRLLDEGHTVRTLTGRPQLQGASDDPFNGQVSASMLAFDRPDSLVSDLQGVDTLFNTYWIRFDSGNITFDRAVENSRTLVNAALEAGVRRLVHISITNPSANSPLPYFRGKGLVEEAIRASGISYAIIRPAMVFGEGDILLNNIAWALRRFPVFPVAGDGHYQVQPVYVGDLAELAVTHGKGEENIALDAVGPEVFTFDELVTLVENTVGSHAKLAHMPPLLAHTLSRVIGYFVHDVVLTKDEISGLAGDLLVSSGPALAPTRFSEWLSTNGDQLGASYASELDRHYRHRQRGPSSN